MLHETLTIEKTKTPAISEGAAYLIRHIDLQRTIRYAIARRLRREKTCARIVVSFLSLIIIASSIASLIFADQLGKTLGAAINVVNIIVSAYIIIMNYEFDKRDFDRQIMMLEKSTTELRELHYAARHVLNWSKAMLDRYTERYNSIMREHKFQTEQRDYQYVMLVNTHLRGENYRSPTRPFFVRIRHDCSHLILIAIWNIFPAMLVAGAIYALIEYPNATH
jgi:hypothetical protein